MGRHGIARACAMRVGGALLRLFYRVRVRGMEHYARAGPRVSVDKMPLLGAGKIDYRAARALVEERLPKKRGEAA